MTELRLSRGTTLKSVYAAVSYSDSTMATLRCGGGPFNLGKTVQLGESC